MMKKIFTLGCCGIDCGLCPRFYTDGHSKCPGCCGDGFEQLHPPCGFITCCVKKKGLEACAQCSDFPCAKFDKETGEADSFVTHRKVMYNQNFIKQNTLEKFTEQQDKRITYLHTMLKCYDDGRCKSFFCLACALLSLEGQDRALSQAQQEIKNAAINEDNKKAKAAILRQLLNEVAQEENVELKLIKP